MIKSENSNTELTLLEETLFQKMVLVESEFKSIYYGDDGYISSSAQYFLLRKIIEDSELNEKYEVYKSQPKMTLKEAIDVFKTEQGVCELEISNGNLNQNMLNFYHACNVIFELLIDYNFY